MRSLIFGIMCLLGIALGFSACTPDPIPIDLPAHQARLSIASLTVPGGFLPDVPDRAVLVSVSRSFSALSDGSVGRSQKTDSAFLAAILVKTAQVYIVTEGDSELLEPYLPGIFISRTVFKHTGQQYTLFAIDTASLKFCYSATTLLPKVPFAMVRPVVERNGKDTTVSVDFTVKRQTGNNYYMVNVYKKTKKKLHLGLADFRGANVNENNMFLFSEKQFADGEYHVHQKIVINPTDSIGITLSNITEDYYKYLSVYLRSGKVFNQIVGEPINYPSNIINGYGFFTVSDPDIHVFDLNKW